MVNFRFKSRKMNFGDKFSLKAWTWSPQNYLPIQDDTSWGAGRGCGESFFSSGKAIQTKSSCIKSQDTEAHSPLANSNWRAGHPNQNDDIKAQICKWIQPVQSGPAVQSISHHPPSSFQLLQCLLSHQEPDYGTDQPETSNTQSKSKGLPEPRSAPNTLCAQEHKHWQQNTDSASWNHSQKHWL